MGPVHRGASGPFGRSLSNRDSARPREAGLEPSVGNVGDGQDTARAETINPS